MNRILILLFAGIIMAASQACQAQELSLSNNFRPDVNVTGIQKIEKKEIMKLTITANGKTTVFELNNSAAAKDLYAQLPLSIKVENYSNNEKIFYPPEKLDITATPKANAKAGTLAYYAPWGDVVMFYANFGSAPGLYELGHAVSGQAYIQEMSGTIQLEK